MRGLILAIGFMTRLPVPAVKEFDPGQFSACAKWFPLVGLLVGLVLEAALRLGSLVDPWFGSLICLIVWIWITGGLHLEGLADTFDALGAAHRNRERFLEVLADPHVGAFGTMGIALQIATKLVLLMLVAKSGHSWIFLVPAWARWSALSWARLPSLKAGLGERFGWNISPASIWFWGIVLAAASAVSPFLLLAPLAMLAWRQFLMRLGGMSGDLLGAGIEIVESFCLLLLVASSR